MSKREKMVMSGMTFEVEVGRAIKDFTESKVKFNFVVNSPRKSVTSGLECDVLVITPAKAYSVECKNYNYLIRGERLAPYWNFVSSGKKGTVVNPILANDNRIRTMRGLLRITQLECYPIENVICVPNNCRIETKCPQVMHLAELINLIKNENNRIYDIDKMSSDFDLIKDHTKMFRR